MRELSDAAFDLLVGLAGAQAFVIHGGIPPALPELVNAGLAEHRGALCFITPAGRECLDRLTSPPSEGIAV